MARPDPTARAEGIAEASYASLMERVRATGFVRTSATGDYAGMYARDSAAHVLAALAVGDDESARRILLYLIACSADRRLSRAPHFLPDESFAVVASDPPLPTGDGIVEQVGRVGAHSHLLRDGGIAQPFRIRGGMPGVVDLVMWAAPGSTGMVVVEVRTDPEDAGTVIAAGAIDAASLPPEANATWCTIPVPAAAVRAPRPGAECWLVVRTAPAAADRAEIGVVAGIVATSPAIVLRQDGSRAAFGSALCFRTDSRPVPATSGRSLGGRRERGRTLAARGLIGAVDLLLAASDGAAGDVSLVVRAPDGTERTSALPASVIGSAPAWYRFCFPPFPVSGGALDLRLAAPEADPATVVWSDASDASGDAVPLPASALAIVLDGTHTVDQPDGSALVVLAWARYVNAHPDDILFRAETAPIIRRWADSLLDGIVPGGEPGAGLMRNPAFEHSRNGVYWECCDLVTNVFASQALREASEVWPVVSAGETADDPRARWASMSVGIAAAVDRWLRTEVVVGGRRRTVYGELIGRAGDGSSGEERFVTGYSWVNLAPVAVDWFAADGQVVEATYEACLEHGAIDWRRRSGDGVDRMLLMDTGSDRWTGGEIWQRHAVIGKGLGWEYALAARYRPERLIVLDRFVSDHLRTDVLEEFVFHPSLPPKDPGNQEQCAWWIVGRSRARRLLAGRTAGPRRG